MNRQSQTALVTGANAGIGRSVVDALLAEGFRVIASGRRPEALAALPADPAMTTTVLDVESPESIDSLLGRLPDGWDQIDVLVNNAGHDRGGRRIFHDADPADIRSVIGTNVIGTMHLTNVVLGPMVERDRGHIVNIGSIQGVYAYPRTATYTASKHAIHGFSECLRQDYADTAIRVTEILPGAVKTEFALNRWHDRARAEEFYEKLPAVLEPSDVADAVVWALAQPPRVDVAQVVVHPAAGGADR